MVCGASATWEVLYNRVPVLDGRLNRDSVDRELYLQHWREFTHHQNRGPLRCYRPVDKNMAGCRRVMTQEVVERGRRMLENGATRQQIADVIGVGVKTIYKYLPVTG